MLDEKINKLLDKNKNNNWKINYSYHFGGYAKINKKLIDFMENFYKTHNILLEPIYTGKMMFGLFDLIQNGYFKKGQSIIALHTGGMQGLQGIENKMNRFRK